MRRSATRKMTRSGAKRGQTHAADNMCYQAEKMLADYGDKITADLRGRIEAALRETKEAVAKKDAPLAEQRADALANC